MSQEKVNKKKEYKANRRVILKKEKRKKLLGRIVSWIIVIAFVGGIGAAIGSSIYNNYKAKLAALPDYKSTDYMLSDMAGILETEAAIDAAGQAVSTEANTVATDAAGQAVITESTATTDAAGQAVITESIAATDATGQAVITESIAAIDAAGQAAISESTAVAATVAQ